MSELSTFVKQTSKLCQNRRCEEAIGVLEEAPILIRPTLCSITNSDSVTAERPSLGPQFELHGPGYV